MNHKYKMEPTITKIIFNFKLLSLVSTSVLLSCGHQGNAALSAQNECKPYEEQNGASNYRGETYEECQERILERTRIYKIINGIQITMHILSITYNKSLTLTVIQSGLVYFSRAAS